MATAFCHVVVGASDKDGDIELRTLLVVFFFRVLCWQCFCMKLTGYLKEARQVAGDVMVQGLSRKRQKEWEAASFPEQFRQEC